MIKKIDNLGRVVVPKGYRVMLGLRPGDPLDVEVDGDRLVLRPHRDGCALCGDPSALNLYLDKKVCSECVRRLKALPGG